MDVGNETSQQGPQTATLAVPRRASKTTSFNIAACVTTIQVRAAVEAYGRVQAVLSKTLIDIHGNDDAKKRSAVKLLLSIANNVER